MLNELQHGMNDTARSFTKHSFIIGITINTIGNNVISIIILKIFFSFSRVVCLSFPSVFKNFLLLVYSFNTH